MTAPNSSIFRREALLQNARARVHGDVLRQTPAWVPRAYFLLCAVCALSACFLSFATLDRYVAGPAVIRRVSEPQPAFFVVAFLPARELPQLRTGLPLYLTLDGFPKLGEPLRISALDEQGVGPAAAQRYQHEISADAMPLTSPRIAVRAPLPDSLTLPDGTALPYREGLVGTAEVRVSRERLLFLLFPALKGLIRHGRK